MNNRLTRMLGITYPIIQGGMLEISFSSLTAAVSNAGGLGTLGQMFDIKRWHDEIKKTKDLTARPFAVNLGLYMSDADERLKIITDEGVKIVVTGGGNPKLVINRIKEAGITALHVVSTSEQAKKTEAMGFDALIAEGGESGGIAARDIVSTLVLIPLVVDAVSIPVVAAGGVADARGLIACLALGAQGVQMGTVFEASEESSAAKEWKEGILHARETDTIISLNTGLKARVIKEEIYPGGIITGQVAGMVKKIEKSRDLITGIMSNVDAVLRSIETAIH